MILTSNNLSFSLNLPAGLTDSTGKIWFYNNADWNNYWKTVTANFKLAIPSVIVPDYIYTSFAFGHNAVTVSAVNYDFASFADLTTLKGKIDTLVTSIINFRQALITAGWLLETSTALPVVGAEDGSDIIGTEQGEELGLEENKNITSV